MKKSQKMETITIDRDFWYRGNGSSKSALLVDGTLERCCVGFMCQHRGISDDAMLDMGYIRDLPNDMDCRSKIADWLDPDATNEEAGWIEMAYAINDDDSISDVDRERRLTALAADHGIKLVFIN